MSVIERTWIGTGRDYPHHKSTTTDEQVANRWRKAGCTVEGPYVLASTAQGGVEEAHRLRNELADIAVRFQSHDAGRCARAALRRNVICGGQST